MKDYIRETIATYEVIANDYQQRRRNASPTRELQRLVTIIPTLTVLDVGTGPGRDASWLSNHGVDVTGIDLCERFLAIAKQNAPKATFYQMNLLELEFPDDTFGGIWCCAVLSHLRKEDMSLALREFFRVLRPSGVAFIAVKEGEGEGFQHEPEFDGTPRRYMSYFEKAELRSLAESVGFLTTDMYLYNELRRFGPPHRDVDFIFAFLNKPATIIDAIGGTG